jgi:type IV secretion system protein VirB10
MAAEPEPKPVAPPAARSARARVSDSDELARSRTSKRYMIFEGTVLESVLLTRINSDFTGPVVAMTSADIYSRDRQELLIPAGTKVVGEARRTAAFGESRVAVVFHRLLMTDGYSVNLDQFTGLSAKGETALKDQVNNHYFKIFGASIAVGAIGGLSAYGTNTAGMAGQSAADTYRQGVAGELGAASRNILERFLNIMPTITIREGHRMRIYITQDMRLPAYRDHDMPSDL